MSEIAHTQTVQAEMEYMLTKEAFDEWLFSQTLRELATKFRNSSFETIKDLYLNEHGLPLNSVIEGL